MANDKRTPKQTAEAVAKTIKDLNKVLEAVPIMKGHRFFDLNIFKSTGFDEVIEKLCSENDISEDHVRRVAGIKGRS